MATDEHTLERGRLLRPQPQESSSLEMGASLKCWNTYEHGQSLMHRRSQVLAWITSSGRRGRLIGSLGYIFAVCGRGAGPRGEKMARGFAGTDSQSLATILGPFQIIFVDLGPDSLSAT